MKTAAAVILFEATLAASKQLAAQTPAPEVTSPANAVQPAAPAGSVQIPPTPLAYKTWPDVNLNVLVTGKHNAPQKIDEHAFRLMEDGIERPLRSPAPADSPISLALLIDFSGSTFEHTSEIVSAVKTIVRALPADSEVTVVDFSFAGFLDIPFTPASKADLSVLDKLKPSGPTALYNALTATETYVAAEAKYPRRAIVIFSDGEDNVSTAAERGVALYKIQQPGAPAVYSCFVAKIIWMPSRYGLFNLKRLAKEGGGLFFKFNTDVRVDPDSAAAAAVAAQIAAAINSQYVLQFTAADAARNSKPHKLKLQLAGKDVEAHTLSTYFAPPN
jgi:VWFA-related protein